MFSIYIGKEKEIPILTELRLPVRRSEQHDRSCKLKHSEILTHDAVRRMAQSGRLREVVAYGRWSLTGSGHLREVVVYERLHL